MLLQQQTLIPSIIQTSTLGRTIVSLHTVADSCPLEPARPTFYTFSDVKNATGTNLNPDQSVIKLLSSA